MPGIAGEDHFAANSGPEPPSREVRLIGLVLAPIVDEHVTLLTIRQRLTKRPLGLLVGRLLVVHPVLGVLPHQRRQVNVDEILGGADMEDGLILSGAAANEARGGSATAGAGGGCDRNRPLLGGGGRFRGDRPFHRGRRR